MKKDIDKMIMTNLSELEYNDNHNDKTLYCKNCYKSYEESVNFLLENEFIEEDDVEGNEPCCVFLDTSTYYYTFTKHDIDQVKQKCNILKQTLNPYIQKQFGQSLDEIYMFNETKLNQLNSEIKNQVVTYGLGIQIQKCLEENGKCDFYAEVE